MKLFLSLFVLMILYSIGHCQIQVDKYIYMQFDLEKKPVSYKTILFKTDPPGQFGGVIQSTLADAGIKGYDYYSLFPQIKTYSSSDILKKLEQYGIEAIMEIIIDISRISQGQSVNSYTTYNKFTKSYNTYGTVNDNSKQHFSGAIYLFDKRDWNNPIVIANGSLSAYWNKSLIIRMVKNTLLGLEKNGLWIRKGKISLKDL